MYICVYNMRVYMCVGICVCVCDVCVAGSVSWSYGYAQHGKVCIYVCTICVYTCAWVCECVCVCVCVMCVLLAACHEVMDTRNMERYAYICVCIHILA
jgi:hypothetical protein